MKTSIFYLLAGFLSVPLIIAIVYGIAMAIKKREQKKEEKPTPEKKKKGGLGWFAFLLAFTAMILAVGMAYYTYTPPRQQKQPILLMSLPLCGGKTLDFSRRRAPGKVVIKFYPQCRTRIKLPEWTEFTWETSGFIRMKFLNSREFVDGPDMDRYLGKGIQRIFNVAGVEKPGTLKILFYRKVR